jgi:miniconductance mechanosensitive channel
METAANREVAAHSAPGASSEVGITNVDVFQAYVTGYLRSHLGINPDMRVLVRQLDPTPDGLPVEIWAFTRATDLDNHEEVQSEILSHVLTIAPEFDLRIFQRHREAP